MADHAFIRAAGNWALDPVPTAVELGQIDAAQKDSVSATGCTVAPSIPITIGGSGLTVSGPASLTDAAVTITNTKKLTLNSGAAIDANSGSNVNIKSGAAANIKSGGSVVYESGAAVSLAANVDPAYSPVRFVSRRGVRLLGVTYAGALGTTLTTNPTNADAWISSFVSGGNVVVAKKLVTLASEHFQLDVPGIQEMTEATLILVRIRTIGLDANTPTNYPLFELFRRNDAGAIVSLQSTGPVTDAHNTPITWNGTTAATDIVPDQNNVVDSGLYDYILKCTPASQTPSGTSFFIQSVSATYQLSKLRK